MSFLLYIIIDIKLRGDAMKLLQINKYPDRKQIALDVYDEEANIHYTVAYFRDEARLNLFLEALTSTTYKLLEGYKYVKN